LTRNLAGNIIISRWDIDLSLDRVKGSPGKIENSHPSVQAG